MGFHGRGCFWWAGDLGVNPFWGVDFISKTKMVLELGRQRCYFAFAPSVTIRFRQGTSLQAIAAKMQYLREHIKTLLRGGVIEHLLSNYSSPMLLMPTPGDAYRVVVDFRMLNKRIAIESVPLPDDHSSFH